jgi:hypothetical protein
MVARARQEDHAAGPVDVADEPRSTCASTVLPSLGRLQSSASARGITLNPASMRLLRPSEGTRRFNPHG